MIPDFAKKLKLEDEPPVEWIGDYGLLLRYIEAATARAYGYPSRLDAPDGTAALAYLAAAFERRNKEMQPITFDGVAHLYRPYNTMTRAIACLIAWARPSEVQFFADRPAQLWRVWAWQQWHDGSMDKEKYPQEWWLSTRIRILEDGLDPYYMTMSFLDPGGYGGRHHRDRYARFFPYEYQETSSPRRPDWDAVREIRKAATQEEST